MKEMEGNAGKGEGKEKVQKGKGREMMTDKLKKWQRNTGQNWEKDTKIGKS
jgi:hypothetical protein